MSDRENSPSKRRQGLSVSVVLGTLLIPLSAFAASVLVTNDGSGDPPATTMPTAAAQPQSVPAIEPPIASSADLVAACGEAGLLLVDAEVAGSISEVQQAALDGLREICTQQGIPLPGKPVPEPIVQTVVVAESVPSQGVDDSVFFEDDHDEDDDDDDDRDDDDDDDHEDDD